MAFSTVTVLAALALLEGATRAFLRVAPNARWVHSRQLTETLGFPAMNDLFLADQRLFWRLKPNMDRHLVCGRFANAPPMSFSVSTDQRGFRVLPAAQPARHRVLFVGDSCTFGLGVDDHQSFPALVQKRLPGVQCINAAVPGYTAYQCRVLLEQLELKPPPQAVVITLGRNDDLTWDHLSDMQHAELIAARHPGLLSRLRSVELVQSVLPRPAATTVPDDRPARTRLTDAEFVDQMGGIIRCCRRWDAEPILVIWPEDFQMRREGAFGKQLALAYLAQTENVWLVNLIDVFRARSGQNLFLDAVHASPAGCELVAEKLLPLLERVLATSPRQVARP